MSLEFLERKVEAIKAVIASYKDFVSALNQLPAEWQAEFWRDLGDRPDSSSTLPTSPVTSEILPTSTEFATSSPVALTAELLPPSNAVRDVLRRHPEGLRPNEIVRALLGKVLTKSEDQERLLYSTIASLHKANKIEKVDGKRYRLIAPSDNNT